MCVRSCFVCLLEMPLKVDILNTDLHVVFVIFGLWWFQPTESRVLSLSFVHILVSGICAILFEIIRFRSTCDKCTNLSILRDPFKAIIMSDSICCNRKSFEAEANKLQQKTPSNRYSKHKLNRIDVDLAYWLRSSIYYGHNHFCISVKFASLCSCPIQCGEIE